MEFNFRLVRRIGLIVSLFCFGTPSTTAQAEGAGKKSALESEIPIGLDTIDAAVMEEWQEMYEEAKKNPIIDEEREAKNFVRTQTELISDQDDETKMWLRIVAMGNHGERNYYIDGKKHVELIAVDEAGNEKSLESKLEFYDGLAFYAFKKGEVPQFKLVLEKAGGEKSVEEVHGSKVSWTSILPPLLAILLALVFRQVVLSLVIGVFIGAWLALGGALHDIFPAFLRVVDTWIIQSVNTSSHVSVIVFSLLIGAMVAVISRNGGMRGIVNFLSRWANSAKNSQLVTWLLGIAIFFDDYANSLIVGNTMRPVTDEHKVSREKLAYIVDSTAAPVSAIAFITTWIGAELDYIQVQIENIAANPTLEPIGHSAYSVFLSSLSYAFYPLLALAFILMIVFTGRDFGPMLKAEKRSQTKATNPLDENATQGGEALDEDLEDLDPEPGTSIYWWNAFIPILTLLLVTFGGLITTGSGEGLFRGLKLFFASPATVIGAADSYSALLWGSFCGLSIALVMSLVSGTLNVNKGLKAMMDGFKTMLPAVIILVLAWGLADIASELRTADFLAGAIGENVDPYWFPALVFLLAALIAFATGTSWGTMAILYPLVLPTAWILCDTFQIPREEALEIFYHSTAVVLAGAVLGDHCSPISDTTVLSSLATKCNHIEHVRTQLPYALVVGLVSFFLSGTLFKMGVPPILCLFVGVVMLFAVVRFFGEKSRA